MAPSERAGKSVFLGNIPYNLTEEQVKDILSTAGTVTKFRLMMNPETGKPKGYGFADFADADAAASAVRNLNDYEIMGRKIRVDWPHNNEKDSIPPDYSQTAAAPGPDTLSGSTQPTTSAPLPPLPPGTDAPSHLDCPNAISQTLSGLPPDQLLEILTQTKNMATSEPARAAELFRQAPQLAYAIFQALLLMNLVDYSVLGSVVEQVAQPAAAPPPAAAAFNPFGAAVPGPVSTPPVVNAPFGQPAPQATPQPMAGHDELLQQVLAMPESAIDALPPLERNQIRLLRQQLRQSGMR